MHNDPHDQLLLTKRPTTIVVEATRLLDSAPAPYGSSEDEENLFAGIGADESNTLLRGPSKNIAALANKVPGIREENDDDLAADNGSGMPIIAAPAPSIWPPIIVIGALLGAMFLCAKPKRK